MATTEYEPDVTVMGREALRHGALRPLGVRVAVRGRLHLCLANIGKSPLAKRLACRDGAVRFGASNGAGLQERLGSTHRAVPEGKARL